MSTRTMARSALLRATATTVVAQSDNASKAARAISDVVHPAEMLFVESATPEWWQEAFFAKHSVLLVNI